MAKDWLQIYKFLFLRFKLGHLLRAIEALQLPVGSADVPFATCCELTSISASCNHAHFLPAVSPRSIPYGLSARAFPSQSLFPRNPVQGLAMWQLSCPLSTYRVHHQLSNSGGLLGKQETGLHNRNKIGPSHLYTATKDSIHERDWYSKITRLLKERNSTKSKTNE